MKGKTKKSINGKVGIRGLTVFFLRFIAASLALFILHQKTGFLYMHIVAWGAKPLLAMFGRALVMERALEITGEISLNPAVYLSLVIALSGIPVRKKIRPALLGVAILTAANILTVFLVFMSFYMKNEALWMGTEFFNLTINFFLPLLLFFVLMPVRNLFPSNSLPA